MFTYDNQFMDAEKNGLDVLIDDEAHRLKETSTNRFTRATLRTGRPQVEELIDEGFSARISAGYCWEWSRPLHNILVDDVQIGSWRRPWNNPKDTQVGDAPGRPFWALDPGGFDQVGCVYTAQGFEYDYGGVIFGGDLVWRDGRWVARPEYSHDNQVRKADHREFDRAIRNTYKVLLTRGMKGGGRILHRSRDADVPPELGPSLEPGD